MKKVVIIGPESTGKSTLCAQLASHFNTEWCPEFARDYLLQEGKDYTYNDLLTIARGQTALEEQFISKSDAPLLFFDTDQYVMKVWCEFVFDNCHPYILDTIAKRKYDLYLLCDIDLPWIADELREYPDERPRQELFHMYKDLLVQQHVPWVRISGDYDQRFNKAVAAVEAHINFPAAQ
ncbi:AAA family ATPase [Filimonas effusa]|uniref:ATPase n=1 Tax=Filimonas effusa TaxID=2508721 RepID=A0A4Q1CZZ7_9BACT|nr:AAA family ATPase [Filimonas effusa]RXK80998.1 ATPase [Filimonas effusa]